MKPYDVCVIGMGYIGLPTGSMFAKSGLNVLGVDTNPAVIKSLQNGRVHIVEPGLQEVVTQVILEKRLRFSSQPEPADAFIVAVPTPFKDGKKADMRFVESAAQSIAPVLAPGNLVVLESTSPPGTTDHLLKEILEQTGMKAGVDFYLVYSPERVLPGKILVELIENSRVIGGVNEISAQAGKKLYQRFVRGEIITTNSTTAEMVKLMENTFRDVNIAIANEFARLADRFGIDVWEAIRIANLHPRVNILNPGPGVGGHCISVDPWFLVEAAPDIATLIQTARSVNDSQPEWVTKWVETSIGSVRGRKIAVLGLTYKPDVDDFRESPAVDVAKILISKGAILTAYDPYAAQTTLDIPLVKSLSEAASTAEVLLILVKHRQFAGLSPDHILMGASIQAVFDATDTLDKKSWASAGLPVFSLGDGSGKMKPVQDQQPI